MAHPTDSSTLFACPFCHNPTLQHYRLLNATATVTRQQLMDPFHPYLGDVRVM